MRTLKQDLKTVSWKRSPEFERSLSKNFIQQNISHQPVKPTKIKDTVTKLPKIDAVFITEEDLLTDEEKRQLYDEISEVGIITPGMLMSKSNLSTTVNTNNDELESNRMFSFSDIKFGMPISRSPSNLQDAPLPLINYKQEQAQTRMFQWEARELTSVPSELRPQPKRTIAASDSNNNGFVYRRKMIGSTL